MPQLCHCDGWAGVRTNWVNVDTATRAEPAEGVELGLLSCALQLHVTQAAMELPYLRLLLFQLGLRMALPRGFKPGI